MLPHAAVACRCPSCCCRPGRWWPPAPTTLPSVQVQAARVPGIDPFALPASQDTVWIDASRAGTGVQLSEALAGVPGLVARDRQNFAQDTQLSIRGFGARSTFGVRGCGY